MEKDKILDVWEISRELGCSADTTRRLVKRKILPHYRVGNRIYTKQSFLDAWIQKQINNSTMETYYEK